MVVADYRYSRSIRLLSRRVVWYDVIWRAPTFLLYRKMHKEGGRGSGGKFARYDAIDTSGRDTIGMVGMADDDDEQPIGGIGGWWCSMGNARILICEGGWSGLGARPQIEHTKYDSAVQCECLL